MRMMSHSVLWLCLVIITGCGGDGFNLAPVSGTVSLNDQPLADTLVTFAPTSTVGPPSWGRTDANGTYSLQTRDGERGAVIGEHRVTITTAEAPEASNERDDVYGSSTPEKVPARYNTDSELTFTVSEDSAEGSADFKLTSP